MINIKMIIYKIINKLFFLMQLLHYKLFYYKLFYYNYFIIIILLLLLNYNY
jgi:hypothetical protein